MTASANYLTLPVAPRRIAVSTQSSWLICACRVEITSSWWSCCSVVSRLDNYVESIALIASEIMELAREGKTVREAMDLGTTLLAKSDVIDGVAEMVHEVQVEATFDDGTKLVTVHQPIR